MNRSGWTVVSFESVGPNETVVSFGPNETVGSI